MSDRAGEVYREARDNTRVVSELTEVAKADRVVILADGEKLAAQETRADTLQGARQLLRVLLDNGALCDASDVQFVITKSDELAKAPDSQQLQESILKFEKRLLQDFGSRLKRLTFWRISARDPNGMLAPAEGVAELLADWLEPSSPRQVSVFPLARQPEGEFDRLMLSFQEEQ
jgi:hypothetical protein